MILDVVQSVATVIGMNVPDAVYGNQAREMVEMRALINRVSGLIRDEFDWQALKRIGGVSGDGVAEGFDLPPDYVRMVRDAELRRASAPYASIWHVQSFNDWLTLDLNGPIPGKSFWIIFGGKLHIKQAPAIGEIFRFPYVSGEIVRKQDGSLAQSFGNDDDAFIINERLLELGLIWSWKAGKSQPYAKELNDYETALAEATRKDEANP